MDPIQREFNTEVLKRLEAIEGRLDQAAGAWWSIKLICSVVLGIALFWNNVHGWHF